MFVSFCQEITSLLLHHCYSNERAKFKHLESEHYFNFHWFRSNLRLFGTSHGCVAKVSIIIISEGYGCGFCCQLAKIAWHYVRNTNLHIERRRMYVGFTIHSILQIITSYSEFQITLCISNIMSNELCVPQPWRLKIMITISSTDQRTSYSPTAWKETTS